MEILKSDPTMELLADGRTVKIHYEGGKDYFVYTKKIRRTKMDENSPICYKCRYRRVCKKLPDLLGAGKNFSDTCEEIGITYWREGFLDRVPVQLAKTFEYRSPLKDIIYEGLI